MTVDILFFAQYRELAGTDRLELDVADGTSVADLLLLLRGRGGGLGQLPEQVAVAIDRVVARPEELVPAGAEVALLPPVAGG